MLYLSLLPASVKRTIVAIEMESKARKSTSQDKVYHKILTSYAKFDDWLVLIESMLVFSECFKLETIPCDHVEPSVYT